MDSELTKELEAEKKYELRDPTPVCCQWLKRKMAEVSRALDAERAERERLAERVDALYVNALTEKPAEPPAPVWLDRPDQPGEWENEYRDEIRLFTVYRMPRKALVVEHRDGRCESLGGFAGRWRLIRAATAAAARPVYDAATCRAIAKRINASPGLYELIESFANQPLPDG